MIWNNKEATEASCHSHMRHRTL